MGFGFHKQHGREAAGVLDFADDRRDAGIQRQHTARDVTRILRRIATEREVAHFIAVDLDQPIAVKRRFGRDMLDQKIIAVDAPEP